MLYISLINFLSSSSSYLILFSSLLISSHLISCSFTHPHFHSLNKTLKCDFSLLQSLTFSSSSFLSSSSSVSPFSSPPLSYHHCHHHRYNFSLISFLFSFSSSVLERVTLIFPQHHLRSYYDYNHVSSKADSFNDQSININFFFYPFLSPPLLSSPLLSFSLPYLPSLLFSSRID